MPTNFSPDDDDYAPSAPRPRSTPVLRPERISPRFADCRLPNVATRAEMEVGYALLLAGGSAPWAG